MKEKVLVDLMLGLLTPKKEDILIIGHFMNLNSLDIFNLYINCLCAPIYLYY